MALDNIKGPPTQVGGDQIAIGLFLFIFDGHDEPFGFVSADIQPCAAYHRYDLSTASDADAVRCPRMGSKVVSHVLVTLADSNIPHSSGFSGNALIPSRSLAISTFHRISW